MAAAAADVRRALKRLARPAGTFDASRYFRGDHGLRFYNTGTKAMRGLVRSLHARHKAQWSVDDAMQCAEILMRDPFLEAKHVGIELVGRYRRQCTPRFLAAWQRWLADGYAANWATTDALCGVLIGPLLVVHPALGRRMPAWTRHPNLWVRRASAVALIPSARRGAALDLSYEVARRLHADPHDLIHKAVGWLLREAGKTDPERLDRYLRENGSVIPRTTLRYAIERFPPARRRDLLEATRLKKQAPSSKLQAPPTKNQAPGTKHQAPSTKHQAPSTKHQAPGKDAGVTSSPPRWRRIAPWVLAVVGYVAFTGFQTWPLVEHLSDVLPHDLGDPALNTWIIWWNAHTLPFTTRWWNAPAFWPSTGAIAFSETLLGLSPVTTPIQWLGWSPVAAYNVAFLITFPLSAIAAHALAWRLTGRHDAGVIAGLIYGFHPFRVAHFPQIQVMTSYWMPLALLALQAYLGDRKTRWLVLFTIAWTMQGLSNGYYLLFFPVLVGVWLLWFTSAPSNWRALPGIAAAFILGSLPLVPLLWGYRQIHSVYNFQRVVADVGEFGADVTSLLDASPQLKFWHLEAFHQPEGELFPGLTAALLVALLGVRWLWTSDPVRKTPRSVVWLLLLSLLFIGVALSAVLVGPWTIEIAGRTLLSVRVITKPLSIGVLLFAVALALVPRFQAAWQRRSTLMFYVFATGLMYLLCFGPQPHFLGVPFMYRGPYSLLMALPGYDAIRVPARFAMLAILCLSAVAALAFARLTRRAPRLLRYGLTVVVACGVMVDSAIGDMPLQALPARIVAPDSLPRGAAVMELPLGYIGDDALAMYRGIFHGHPVVNGYSGFFPRSYDVLRRGLDTHDPQIFDAVTAWGPVAVMIEKARDAGGVWANQLDHRPNTVFLGEQSGWKLYSLAAGEPPPEIDARKRLKVVTVSANVNANRAPLAIDGDPGTRWDSGAQQGIEVFTVDLGQERRVDALTMTIGIHPMDFPRSLAIDTSADGQQWTTQWTGASSVAGFTGGIRSPREMPLLYALPHVPARWIRLRQMGQDPVFYWSIFELNVFGE